MTLLRVLDTSGHPTSAPHYSSLANIPRISVRNKAFPVVQGNQNLWQTINSYHEAAFEKDVFTEYIII